MIGQFVMLRVEEAFKGAEEQSKLELKMEAEVAEGQKLTPGNAIPKNVQVSQSSIGIWC